MTEQKPPGMTWDAWIEQQLREADEQGAFENLPGFGRPLPGLEAGYDPDWWVKQFVQREGVSVLPPALELLRKVERVLAGLSRLSTEAQVREQLVALNAEIAKVNARTLEGPATRLGVLDVDSIINEWRARRVASQ
jgi:DnaJ homologue, subfamily C, member 28, conserved domain